MLPLILTHYSGLIIQDLIFFPQNFHWEFFFFLVIDFRWRKYHMICFTLNSLCTNSFMVAITINTLFGPFFRKWNVMIRFNLYEKNSSLLKNKLETQSTSDLNASHTGAILAWGLKLEDKKIVLWILNDQIEIAICAFVGSVSFNTNENAYIFNKLNMFWFSQLCHDHCIWNISLIPGLTCSWHRFQSYSGCIVLVLRRDN